MSQDAERGWTDWIDLRGILVLVQLTVKVLLVMLPFGLVARMLGPKTIGGEIAGVAMLAIYAVMAGAFLWTQAARLGADIYDTLGPNADKRRTSRRQRPSDSTESNNG